MLKRTMILLGLTITIGALLLVAGCGGHNSSMPFAPSGQAITGHNRGGNLPSAPLVSLGMALDGTRWILVRATDPERDRLKYRIVIKGTNNFVFDQTQDTSGWSAPDYASGQWGWFKLPNLPSGSYSVQAQAFDGSNWGPMNNPPRVFSVP